MSDVGADRGYLAWILSIVASALSILILLDAFSHGEVRRWLDRRADELAGRRPRSRREPWTPGAELVIRRATELTEEASRDGD